MDAAAELGRNPVRKHQIQPEYGDEQADAGRDGRTRLARPNSQARTGTGECYFPCSADHEQEWQPYTVDPYSAICDDYTYIHTYIHTVRPVPTLSGQAIAHRWRSMRRGRRHSASKLQCRAKRLLPNQVATNNNDSLLIVIVQYYSY